VYRHQERDLELVVFDALWQSGYKVCRNCWVYFGGVGSDHVSSVRCSDCKPRDFETEIERLVGELGPFRWEGENISQYEIDVVGNYQGIWYLIEVKQWEEPVPCEKICWHYARASHFVQRASWWFPVYVTTSGYENEICKCNGRTILLQKWRGIASGLYMYKLKAL